MKEAMKEPNREGRKGIEAAPASIDGLGDAAAFTSAASASAAPIIIITTTKRTADTYLPAPAIVAHTPGNTLLLVVDTENTKP